MPTKSRVKHPHTLPRADHRGEPICCIFTDCPATFDDHFAKCADPTRFSDRAKRDAELKPAITWAFEEHLSVYGVCTVWHPMHREDCDIARCIIARLAKNFGIEGEIRGQSAKRRFPTRHYLASRIA